MLKNFIHQVAKDSILVYISHKSNNLHFDFGVRNIFFNVINEDSLHKIETKLNKFFKEVEKKNKNMILVSDWSKANLTDCDIFFPFLENLTKKSRSSTPGWKRKYRGSKQKFPLTIINAFEVTRFNDNLIQEIIPLHQRIFLLNGNSNLFLLPTISPTSTDIFPKFHVLPQEISEKLVKNNLELITLLFLERDGKSGYQLLKNIASHFHCILSQGTLYPLLYQLEKKKEIIKQNGKGREVIYSLTQKTRNELKSKKEVYLKAYQHLAGFFDAGGGAFR